MKIARSHALLFFFSTFLLFTLFVVSPIVLRPTKAVLSSCGASINPSTMTPSSTQSFTLTINNTGSTPIVFIKFVRPSENFVISDYQATGWSGAVGSTEGTLTGGSISPANSYQMIISLRSGGSTADAANLVVEASDAGDGLGKIGCTGSLGVSIAGTPPDTSPPNFTSDITVSDITSSSAKVSFTTDESTTTQIDYGTSSGGEDSVLENSSLSTSHTLSLTGLTINTTYYYSLTIWDASRNSSQTDEFTITTASSASTSTTVTNTVTVTNTTTSTVTNTVTKIVGDTTPPAIRYINEFESVYEEAPIVEVSSTDEKGITRLEYSIDGGDNWYPIDINDFLGDKQISTKFIPNAFEDGDYSLIVRSVDTSGNKASTKEVLFTIDRLPPRVGPMLTFVGPIILGSGLDGFTDLLAGIEYKFILSSAGGPNKITFSCMDNSYDLTRNPDTGFWFTKIKFEKEGDCVPRIFAEDGAGNKEEIDRGKLRINKIGKLENAILTIYWFDSFSNKFVLWEGLSYGQENPINTHDLGGYGIVLPPGKYYLEAKSVGKRTSISNIIESSETIFINDDWELSPAWKFWQLREEKIITPKIMGSKLWKDTNFQLPNVTLGNLFTNDIKGRVSIIALTTSWYPLTNEYLKTLDILAKEKINIIPILMQERENIARFLKRRGGYNLEIYSDQDGELLKDINSVNNYPTTWIVNKFGQVVKEKVGMIDYQEVVDEINKLN